MKQSLIFLSFLGIIGMAIFILTPTTKIQPINSLIGDASYVARYGKLPDANSNEQDRVSTHLAFVDHILRQRDISDLSTQACENRIAMLDKLSEYWQTGVFPRNYEEPGRAPCFIDQDGRICAVGYLVEKSAGLNIAKEINESFQYADIEEMDIQLIDDWAEENGFTREELAMIQPTYNNFPPIDPGNESISSGYALTSTIFGITNASIGTINAIQLKKQQDGKLFPFLGLATGSGQTLLGISQLQRSTTEEGQKKNYLSFLNIGAGAGTMLLSTLNLISQGKRKKNQHWGVETIPLPNEQLGVQVSYRKTF